MKKRLSKMISLLLAICMIMTAGQTASAAEGRDTFSDMPTQSEWSYAALRAAVDNGLLQGADEKLLPDGKLTRAQMAAVVNRAFGAFEQADISVFGDVPAGAWYAPDIAKAVRMGTFQGSGRTMNPDGYITRQEVFTVLSRAFRLESADASVLNQFSDRAQLAPWAESGAAAIVSAGYVQGAGGKLNPLGEITRAEFAQILYKMVAVYDSAAGTYTDSVSGNVMINRPDVTVKDAVIAGDVIIGDGVGSGDVTFDSTKISGHLLVRGGGENTIRFINRAEVGSVIVSKSCSGNVRLYNDSGMPIPAVEIPDGEDAVILEGAFGGVTVGGDVSVILRNAAVDALTLTGADAAVTVTGKTKIDNMTISKAAAAADVTVEHSAAINKVESAADGVTISGDGTVKEAVINGNNTAVDIVGAKVTAGADATGVTQNGVPVTAEETAVGGGTAAGGGGSIGGGGEEEPPAVPSAITFSLDSDGLPRIHWTNTADKPAGADTAMIVADYDGQEETLYRCKEGNQSLRLTTGYLPKYGTYSKLALKYAAFNENAGNYEPMSGGAQTDAAIRVTDGGTLTGVTATFSQVPGEDQYSYRLRGLESGAFYTLYLLAADQVQSSFVELTIVADENGEASGGCRNSYAGETGEQYFVYKYSDFAVDSTGEQLTYTVRQSEPAPVGDIAETPVRSGAVTFTAENNRLMVHWENPNGIPEDAEDIVLDTDDRLSNGCFGAYSATAATSGRIWLASFDEDATVSNLRVVYAKYDAGGERVPTGTGYVSDAKITVHCLGKETSAAAAFYVDGDDTYYCRITGLQPYADTEVFLVRNGATVRTLRAHADGSGNVGPFSFDCVYDLTECSYQVAERIDAMINDGGRSVSCNIYTRSDEVSCTVEPMPQLPQVENIRFEMLNGEPYLMWDFDKTAYPFAIFSIYVSNNNGQTWDYAGETNDIFWLKDLRPDPETYTNFRVIVRSADLTHYADSQPADYAGTLSVVCNSPADAASVRFIKTGQTKVINGEECDTHIVLISGVEPDAAFFAFFDRQTASRTELNGLWSYRFRADENGVYWRVSDYDYPNSTYKLLTYGTSVISGNSCTIPYTPYGSDEWQVCNPETIRTGNHITGIALDEGLNPVYFMTEDVESMDSIRGGISADGTNWFDSADRPIRRNIALFGTGDTYTKYKTIVLMKAAGEWVVEKYEADCDIALTNGGTLTGVTATWTTTDNAGGTQLLKISGLTPGRQYDVVYSDSPDLNDYLGVVSYTADSNGIAGGYYGMNHPYIYIREYSDISVSGLTGSATVKDSGWIGPLAE